LPGSGSVNDPPTTVKDTNKIRPARDRRCLLALADEPGISCPRHPSGSQERSQDPTPAASGKSISKPELPP